MFNQYLANFWVEKVLRIIHTPPFMVESSLGGVTEPVTISTQDEIQLCSPLFAYPEI